MTTAEAIDLYVTDMKASGRMNSPATERTYRSMLARHMDDIANRDPRTVGREDVKRTLGRWANPNSQKIARSVLVSYYDWCMEEGHRKDNPARQTRKPKKRPTNVYRLTLSEVQALMNACATARERRVIFVGICAGLRNAELQGLKGIHFQRPGLVWVSKDIAKGGRERYVPVVPDLREVWQEIHANVPPGAWVLPSTHWSNPGVNSQRVEGGQPISAHGIRYIVAAVARRAGIEAHIYPHLLRHAFGDHIARYAGMRNAQFMLGHANVGTTETYTGAPTLDDLTAAVADMTFQATPDGMTGSTYGVDRMPHNVRSRSAEQPMGSPADPADFGRVLVCLRRDLTPLSKVLAGGLR